jgi:hypothetical protein
MLFVFGQVLVDVGDVRRMVLTTRLALQQISPHDDHLPVCFSWGKRFAWSLVGAQWHFTVGFVFLTCLQNSFDLFAMVFTVLDLAHLQVSGQLHELVIGVSLGEFLYGRGGGAEVACCHMQVAALGYTKPSLPHAL